MANEKRLLELIDNKEAHVGVIGLGLVGFPMAVMFAEAGYKVTGFDVNPAKVMMVNNKKSCEPACATDDQVAKLVGSGNLSAAKNFSDLDSCDVKIIAVPTYITRQETPDVEAVSQAAKTVAQNFDTPSLVVLESTVYPGATEEIIKGELEKAHLKEGKDFWLAYAPSRIDPGNERWPLKKVPTIVGGHDPISTQMVEALYRNVVDTIHTASSLKAAEMTKLHENSFRVVNIAYVEQLKMNCEVLGIDVWEILQLAKTKPYGYLPFYPGSGVGGDCIPTVPMYIAWKVREHGKRANFIELASQINDTMPYYVSNRLLEMLNDDGKPMKGSNILLIGIAFKKDIPDTKNTPAEPIIRLLKKRGAKVNYHDPLIADFASKKGDISLQSLPLDVPTVKEQDAIVIITDHSNINYELIANNANLVFDTRNALADYTGPHIFY